MSGASNRKIAPTAAEVVCPRCEEKLPASATFCGKCGQRIDQPTITPRAGPGAETAHLGQVAGTSEAPSRPLPPAPFSHAIPTRAARSLEDVPVDLPLAACLIGRGEVVEDVMANLRAGATSGIFAPAGVGKTALAAEAMARLAQEQQVFPGGVAWITCEGLKGEVGLAELWTKVARALHLEQVLAQTSLQKRRTMLALTLAQRKRVLLALDNIEPGLDAGAVLETLVVRGHATLLLTARQCLLSHHIAAFDLGPLNGEGARALYLQRLYQVEGSSPLPHEEAALAELLESLGNVPLAIELTAAYARVQALGLEQTAQEARSDSLNARALQGSANVLLACFDRSWAALPTRVQHLFAGLSLVQGASFPRAIALALAEGVHDDADTAEARDFPLGDVATLVNAALVQTLPGGERMRLHPLLRKYAEERLRTLPPALPARLGNAMAVYWLAYASAHPGDAGVDALEAEASGLMGAVAWAQEHARYRLVLHLTRALRHAWNVRRRHDEEVQLSTWASSAAEKLGDRLEQRWALHQLGVIQHRLGHWREAQASYERALTCAWQEGDLSAERDEVYALALLDQQRGRLSSARAGHEQALLLARQSGNLTAEWEGVHALALLDAQVGRLSEAGAHYEQALTLARRLGEPVAEAIELGNFGLFLSRQGERDRGRALIHESLEMSGRLGNTYDVGKGHQFLAWLDREEGNRPGALTHSRKALRCFEQVGSPEARKVRADLRRLEAEAAVEEPFRPEVVRVMRAFLNEDNSWDETRALLEQEQALLMADETEQFLGALIEQAQQEDTLLAKDRADFFAAHLFLLRDARASTIQAAWERFQQTLQQGEQDEEAHNEPPARGLTHEEAERAAQDASFLAKQFGLSADNPQLPLLQQHLRDFLAEQQETL